MKKIENGNFHHTLVSTLSCVLLMAVAGGISEHMLTLWSSVSGGRLKSSIITLICMVKKT